MPARSRAGTETGTYRRKTASCGLTLQPRDEITRVDRDAGSVDVHLVGVIALLKSGDLLDIEHIEAAAAAGVDDKGRVLIVHVAPPDIVRAVVARRPGRHHHGEAARQRHHVAERADLEMRLRTR